MRLDLYLARRFLAAFAMVFAIFFLLYLLLDMVEQIRRFDSAVLGLRGILHMTLLNTPAGLYEILPLITILAALVLFVGLARSSELVVVRAAGQSALRSLMAPLGMAVLIGGLAVALLNPIVAATSQQYELRMAQLRGSGQVFSISREGLWLRQGGADGQVVIRAARANLDGTRLFDVSFLGFAPDGAPAFRILADEAELIPGAWRLGTVKHWPLSDTANPERAATTSAEHLLPSDLTQEQIRDSFGTPSAIAIWDLPAFIARLEEAGFSARTHRAWFQQEMSLPVMLVAMVMIGAAFTMRQSRLGRTGLMVLYAILLAFSIYFIRNFARIMSENGQIPIALAVWAPPVAAILLALGLLLHLEDG